jgi:hypothetical protein
VIALPGFAPEVEAKEAVALAKADRLEVGSLAPDCFKRVKVENAVILPYVNVARHVRLRNVVIDRGVTIPEGLVVGEDPELDAKRFRTSPQGINLITQQMIDRLNA